jgi:AraC family transcriptional regulator
MLEIQSKSRLVGDTAQEHRSAVEADEAPAPPTAMETAVRQAVTAMRADLFCTDGIAGIAAGTFYSKFHFTREFTRITGTTPRRFLAALRVQKAKDLLISSDMGIADISSMVGYSSVGTFSTRFSALVGMAPRQWRAQRGQVEGFAEKAGDGTATLTGVVEGQGFDDRQFFVGVYPCSIIQGEPAACTRVAGSGHFELSKVPEGEWTVVVHAGGNVDERGTRTCPATTGVHARYSAKVWPESKRTRQLPMRVRLRMMDPVDPPVLFQAAAAAYSPFAGHASAQPKAPEQTVRGNLG